MLVYQRVLSSAQVFFKQLENIHDQGTSLGLRALVLGHWVDHMVILDKL